VNDERAWDFWGEKDKEVLKLPLNRGDNRAFASRSAFSPNFFFFFFFFCIIYFWVFLPYPLYVFFEYLALYNMVEYDVDPYNLIDWL